MAQVCAVLAAVSEVVKEKGGKDTETEYLGTLVRMRIALFVIRDPLQIAKCPGVL